MGVPTTGRPGTGQRGRASRRNGTPRAFGPGPGRTPTRETRPRAQPCAVNHATGRGVTPEGAVSVRGVAGRMGRGQAESTWTGRAWLRGLG